MSVLHALVIGFAVSLLGTVYITRNTRLRQLGSVLPSADRWHAHATPGLGGVAMFLGFLCSLLIAEVDAQTLAILCGACVLFLVGLVDDLRSCSASLKLLTQCVAASLVVILQQESWTAIQAQGVYLLPEVLWIVMIANGINLLDNMDGLAGGIAMIACVAIVILLNEPGSDHQPIELMMVGLAGALFGFLLLNVNPAKVFMGDSGSQWIGLVIGSASYSFFEQAAVSVQDKPLAWFVPVLIVAVPLVDTLFVMITRSRRGQPVTQGGRDHLSHRLVSLGYSERSSVGILWMLGAGGSGVALAIVHADILLWLPLLGFFVLCMTLTVRAALHATLAQAQGT